MVPRAFVTRPIPKQALGLLEGSLDVEVWTQQTGPPIRDRIADLDGLLTYGHEPVTAAMMDGAPRLKVIANMGVGYDHIDVAAASERGISVGYTPGVLDETTADMAFALLLAAARNVVRGDRFIRDGNWTKYDPDLLWGAQVHGATLGIIGLGRIGTAVARRALGFGMSVLYHNRHRALQLEEQLGVEYASLAGLLAQSDFVSIHTPLTPQTHHLIGTEELALMKSTAILVNTARGPVVDGRALFEALRDGTIAGAGLDVFEIEPIPAGDPLLALENVVVCPHLGSATEQTRTQMGLMAAQCLLAGVRGQPLPYPANPEVNARQALRGGRA
jgi:glyoxylate reductase